MREIEFRAWDKEKNSMHKVEEISFDKDGTVHGLLENATCRLIFNERVLVDDKWINDVVLMQHTGLRDKNGTKIYEGDIIQLVNEDNETVKAVCKFGNRRLTTIYGSTIDVQCYYFQIGDRKTNPVAVNYMGVHDLDIVEVIGNLYENPELLEN